MFSVACNKIDLIQFHSSEQMQCCGNKTYSRYRIWLEINLFVISKQFRIEKCNTNLTFSIIAFNDKMIVSCSQIHVYVNRIESEINEYSDRWQLRCMHQKDRKLIYSFSSCFLYVLRSFFTCQFKCNSMILMLPRVPIYFKRIIMNMRRNQMTWM